MHYPVNEIFVSIQGEATFTGRPSVFIRLQGCDVGCSWCDTKHSWQTNPNNIVSLTNLIAKDTDRDSWAKLTIEQIINYIEANFKQVSHVVITGGEPAMYDLMPLITQLELINKQVQLETSGIYKLNVSQNTWVTVSPKIHKELVNTTLMRANEIKMPVGKMADIIKLKEILARYNIKTTVWLQPLSQNPSATRLCFEQAILNNYHLSVQTHKYLDIR